MLVGFLRRFVSDFNCKVRRLVPGNSFKKLRITGCCCRVLLDFRQIFNLVLNSYMHGKLS